MNHIKQQTTRSYHIKQLGINLTSIGTSKLNINMNTISSTGGGIQSVCLRTTCRQECINFYTNNTYEQICRDCIYNCTNHS